MKILIDGDASPKPIKEIIFRASEREKIITILVANTYMSLPKSPFISIEVVPHGPDEADDRITVLAEENDLIITADIPLADRVVSKGACALNPRGKFYDSSNIKAILTMRNLMDDLRSGGMETGGPPPFSNKEKQLFSQQLDKFIAKWKNDKKRDSLN